MKFTLVLILTSILALPALSQNSSFKAYLDQTFQETSKRKAVYVRQMEMVAENTYTAEVREVGTEILKMKGEFVVESGVLKEHGDFTFYHANGKPESKGTYDRGFKVGAWERYTSSGARRPDRYYDPARTEILEAIGKH